MDPHRDRLKPGTDFRSAVLARRQIPARPRTVFWSDPANAARAQHRALEIIARKSERGESLTPHLSRGLARSGTDDLMMADWGIHHLHLSSSIEADGFVSRTRDVLFAKVTSTAIYFIVVLPHGHGHCPWTDVDILEVMHRHWPDATQDWVVQGVRGRRITVEERQKLRHAGVLSPAVLSDGTILRPSFGITTARTSGEAVVLCDRDSQLVIDAQRSLGTMAILFGLSLIDITGPDSVLIEENVTRIRVDYRVPR